MHQFGLELAVEMLENNRSKEKTGNEKSLTILVEQGTCEGVKRKLKRMLDICQSFIHIYYNMYIYIYIYI